MKFLLNAIEIYTGQTYNEIKKLLEENQFNTSSPEYSSEIIFHGEMYLEKLNHKIVIHMYFGRDTEEIQSMIIHPFPIDFDLIQNYLEEQFGTPNEILGEKKVAWKVGNGQVVHQMIERFGDEEMVYVEFD